MTNQLIVLGVIACAVGIVTCAVLLSIISPTTIPKPKRPKRWRAPRYHTDWLDDVSEDELTAWYSTELDDDPRG